MRTVLAPRHHCMPRYRLPPPSPPMTWCCAADVPAAAGALSELAARDLAVPVSVRTPAAKWESAGCAFRRPSFASAKPNGQDCFHGKRPYWETPILGNACGHMCAPRTTRPRSMEGMQVCSLVEQSSIAKCIHGKSFGCEAGYMWVRGCRGAFQCDGVFVSCGYPPGQQHYTCPCNKPPSLAISVTAAKNLQLRFGHDGFLVRTIDCWLPQLPHQMTREDPGACSKHEASRLRSSDMLPASWLRSDLPFSVYHESAAKVATYGLVLTIPTPTRRGPAFPHDAWTGTSTGSVLVNSMRPACAPHQHGDLQQYVSARWSAAVDCNRSDAKGHTLTGRASGRLTWWHLISKKLLTCWSYDWEGAVRKQRGYATLVRKLGRSTRDSVSKRCKDVAEPGHNELRYRSDHASEPGSLLALFYMNFSLLPPQGADPKLTTLAASLSFAAAQLAQQAFETALNSSTERLPIVQICPSASGVEIKPAQHIF